VYLLFTQQLGCSANFISSLGKLVIITLPPVGSHVVRPRQIFCFWQWYFYHCGPGSSVGIATEYGLDGPGSNPGGDEISPGL